MYRAPRGTKDILPKEQPFWRYVEQKAAEICLLYGYERIDLPMFENASLFTSGVGEGTAPIVTQELVLADVRQVEIGIAVVVVVSPGDSLSGSGVAERSGAAVQSLEYQAHSPRGRSTERLDRGRWRRGWCGVVDSPRSAPKRAASRHMRLAVDTRSGGELSAR